MRNDLAADIEKLKAQLEATVPAGLKATDTMEGFRASITATAIALERIQARDFSAGRFSAVSRLFCRDTGPKAIGPDA